MAEEDHCFCEDPYNTGLKLLLCGQAVCLRLQGSLKKPALVAYFIKEEDEDKEVCKTSS